MDTIRIRKHDPKLYNLQPNGEYDFDYEYYFNDVVYYKNLRIIDKYIEIDIDNDYYLSSFHSVYFNKKYYHNEDIMIHTSKRTRGDKDTRSIFVIVQEMKTRFPGLELCKLLERLKGTAIIKEYMRSIKKYTKHYFTYNYDLNRQRNKQINESIIAYHHTPSKYSMYLDTGIDELQIYV